ncbi:hypothetical protein DRO37_09325 [Candidatus Bathyarchaeota archaeon]|nr:MAG: hypothetical protein DRO37_09325 [Candidatus Bathyarchaeota archaeon]
MVGLKRKRMNFRSKEAYRKWLAYGHIHGIFAKTPGHVKVFIRGRPHKVKHSISRRSRRSRRRRR